MAEVKFVLRAEDEVSKTVDSVKGSIAGLGSSAVESFKQSVSAALDFSEKLRGLSDQFKQAGKDWTMNFTVPIAAAGAAFTAAGVTIDEAFDRIRVGTGATGSSLVGLQQSFETVFSTVPVSADVASFAIAHFNTTLGLTGPQLEQMATTVLNLARITGTDLNVAVENTAKMFNSWGLSGAEALSSLDILLRVTQMTGVSLDSLQGRLVQFGPALRAMGFSFTEAAAMIGQFELAGVPVERVMMGLQSGLGRLAKAGEDVPSAFRRIVDEIRNAGSASEAAGIAVTAFGSRAGVQLADAIRSGRFEVDALVAAIGRSPETVAGATAAVDGFQEAVRLLWNQLTLALEPVGTAMMQAFTNVAPVIQGAIGLFADLTRGFAALPTGVQETVFAFGLLTAAVGPVLFGVSVFLNQIAQALPILVGMASGVSSLVVALGGIGPLLGAIGAVAATAFIGWGIGTVIRDLTGLGAWLDEVFIKLNLFKNRTDITDQNQQMTNLQAAADALAAKFPQLSAEVQRGGKTMDEWAQAIAAANVKARELSPTIDKHGASMTGAAQATRALTEEQERLKTAFENQLKPLNAIAANYTQLVPLGVKLVDFAAVHRDQIIKAAEAQKAFGQALSPQAEILLGIARVLQHEADVARATATAVEESARRQREAIASIATGAEQANLKIAANWEQMAVKVGQTPLKLEGVLEPMIHKNLPVWGAAWEQTAKNTSDVWARQMSTIVTDFSKGVADMIFSGRSFGETMKGIFAEFGKGVVRTLIESLFSPLKLIFQNIGTAISGLLSGKGFAGFGDIFKGFGGAGAGGFLGGLAGMATGVGVGAKGLGGLLGGGIGGAISGGTAGFLGASLVGNIAASLSAGTGIMAGMRGFMSALGAIPLWGQLALGAGMALGPLISLFKKSPIEAGAKEFQRDLGGIGISTKELQGYLQSIGLTQKQFEGIRKDILVSPKFLTEVAFPIAQAQGKTEQFLASLQNVQTAWGTFDFRTPFEAGLKAGGSFEALNAAFVKAFGSSKALVSIMPDFAMKLAAVATGAGNAADALDELSKARVADLSAQLDWLDQLAQQLEALGPKLTDSTQDFVQFGIISDEMRAKLVAAGADMAVFDEFARLTNVKNTFADLRAEWERTGVILPGMRQMFIDFGGDLQALDRAAMLPAMRESLGFLNQFAASLQSMLPKIESPLERFLRTGEMTEELRQKLTTAGVDPAQLVPVGQLIGYRAEWSNLVAEYQKTGRLPQQMMDAIRMFFPEAIGEANKALSGIGTVSQATLDKVRAAIEAAFQQQVPAAIQLLQQATSELTNQMNQIMLDVNNAMTVVETRIGEAFEKARLDALAQIALMVEGINLELAKIIVPDIAGQIAGQIPATTTAPPLGVPPTTTGEEPPPYVPPAGIYPRLPGFATGGYVERSGPAYLHEGEYVVPRGETAISVQLAVTLQSTNRSEAERYVDDILIPVIIDAFDTNRGQSRERLRTALNRR